MDLSILVLCAQDQSPPAALASRFEEVRATGSSVELLRVQTHDAQLAISAARGRICVLYNATLPHWPDVIFDLCREFENSSVDVMHVGTRNHSRIACALNTIHNRLFAAQLHPLQDSFLIARRDVLLALLFHCKHATDVQSLIPIAAHLHGYGYRQIELPSSPSSQHPSWRAVARQSIELARAYHQLRKHSASSSLLRSFLTQHPNPTSSPESSSAQPLIQRLRWSAYFATFNATHWMMTRQAEAHLDALRQSQWLSPQALRELQISKLQRLIHHAYHHVPFYRDRMRAVGIAPSDIKSIEDLQRLPLLSKDEVRQHLHAGLLSDNHDKSRILKITTSGSTGEPLVCFADREQLNFRWAATHRAMEWTGWRLGDRQLRLWHQTIGMTPSQIAREHADAWLQRRKFIPAYEMSESTLRSFVRRIERWNPLLLDGYAESFNFLARYLQEHRRIDIRPKGIISSAQTLPEASRRIIEEAFGCRVFDKYGSREFSGIAYECEAHEGHHVVGEGYLVEILNSGRPARPGEVGEVVITDLNNLCLPFIRYRIGDLAEALTEAPCRCGRGLPRIGRIEGRVQSIILGASGQYVPGTFFVHLLKDYDHIVRQFQVVQTERGAITFNVVKGAHYDDKELHRIIDRMHQFLGANMNIRVAFREVIELGRTGKRMATVSRLPINFQELPDARQS